MSKRRYFRYMPLLADHEIPCYFYKIHIFENDVLVDSITYDNKRRTYIVRSDINDFLKNGNWVEITETEAFVELL